MARKTSSPLLRRSTRVLRGWVVHWLTSTQGPSNGQLKMIGSLMTLSFPINALSRIHLQSCYVHSIEPRLPKTCPSSTSRKSPDSDETLEAQLAFERYASSFKLQLKSDQAHIRRFAENKFMPAVKFLWCQCSFSKCCCRKKDQDFARPRQESS